MPQLDFSIWMINLITCWSMFFLVYTSVNSITNDQNISSNNISNTDITQNNWPW